MGHRYLTPVGWMLAILLLSGTLALAQGPVGHAAPTISDVRLSNVGGTLFVASWVTDVPSTGLVQYGSTPSLGHVANDTRGTSYVGQTHYVALTGLDSTTTYYLDVVSESTVGDNGGAHWQMTTGPTISPPASDFVWGRVYQEDGATFAEGAIVYVQVQDGDGAGSSGQSAPLSTLVTDTGYWSVNLSNARRAELSGYFGYSAGGDRVVLDVRGGDMGQANLTVDTDNDSPAPAMRLGPPPSTHYMWMPLTYREARR